MNHQYVSVTSLAAFRFYKRRNILWSRNKLLSSRHPNLILLDKIYLYIMKNIKFTKLFDFNKTFDFFYYIYFSYFKENWRNNGPIIKYLIISYEQNLAACSWTKGTDSCDWSIILFLWCKSTRKTFSQV